MENRKLEELLSDKEFLRSIVKLGKGEAIKAEFAKNGVTVTDEEVEGVCSAIAVKICEDKEAEESRLDEVVGGKLSKGAKIALFTTLGIVGAAGLGVGGYFSYRRLKKKNSPERTNETPNKLPNKPVLCVYGMYDPKVGMVW